MREKSWILKNCRAQRITVRGERKGGVRDREDGRKALGVLRSHRGDRIGRRSGSRCGALQIFAPPFSLPLILILQRRFLIDFALPGFTELPIL